MDLTVDSPETLAWQDERDTVAADLLAGLPIRARMAELVAGMLADTRVYPVVVRDGRHFQRLVLDAGADHPVLTVRDEAGAEPRVLVDPNKISADRGTPTTLMLAEPAPDGRHVAVVLVEAGREAEMELQVIEVETGRALEQPVPAGLGGLRWSPDSASLWISTQGVVDGQLSFAVHRVPLGGEPEVTVPLTPDVFNASFLISPDGRHVALTSGNTEQKLDWLVVDGGLRPLLHGVPGGAVGAFDGDDLIAIVDDGAPRGRLVRIPVATAGDTSTWIELVAESDDVLRAVAVVDGSIVLGYLRDATSRLRVLDRDGGQVAEVELPEEGTVCAYPVGASHPGLPTFLVGDGEISFVFSSFARSWTSYRYLVGERRLVQVGEPTIELDGLVVSTVVATSADGTQVPARVVHRADLDRSQPQPTLVYGYGGFNLAYMPSFESSFSAWVQAGGVFVLAHLRGGSEFGTAWWQQGHRQLKQNTFNDLYAVAELLLADGVTTREQLAVKGESNGGLLTGAAITQRPDLWAAVVSDVPLLDLLEFHRDPLTFAIGHHEYGNPLDPTEAEWLRAISPVHNVVAADYPPLLVTAGLNDPRCPTWHARVFVDRVEQETTGDAPVLLRTYADQGHATADQTQTIGKHADWLGFVATHTGLAL